MIKIIIGVVVLGIVVLFHELGHFVAALWCRVEVLSFSVGMGPVLFRKKFGKTEYRLSMLPLGGYCGMKGEQAFQTALDQKLSRIPVEPGSLYAVGPLKRMGIAFAGPLANVLMAVMVLALVSALGSRVHTFGNRISPVYVYDSSDNSPARRVGLQDGDTILRIGDQPIRYFSDIQKIVSQHAQRALPFVIERRGQLMHVTITPDRDAHTGMGRVGIYHYVPLVVAAVDAHGAASRAGLEPEDKILAVAGRRVQHAVQLLALLKEFRKKSVVLTVLRSGKRRYHTIALVRTENGAIDVGIEWKAHTVVIPGTSFFASVRAGIAETLRMCVLTVKGIGMLFRGLQFQQAISGPLRITHVIGDVAQHGFQESFLTGLSQLCEFVALVCVSLFIMNLLPIPILDGGLILFACVELFMQRSIHPRVLYYLQFVGFAFVALIFLCAFWNDVNF